ncbi:MAG: FAD:protein FMN transferase [Flavobacteriales bacterium]|nr:FAD:protein FMN transferase [Flavobacteriales bacterium]
MGSAFELILYKETSSEADRLFELAFKEIERIEDLISEFRPHSELSAINKNSGLNGVKVSNEVFQLFERSINLSRLTKGAFDVTVGPLKKLYKFENRNFIFPSKQNIKEALDKVGFQKIRIDRGKKEVYLTEKNMTVSFAAIGKGYAADVVKKLWIEKGVEHAVISASGDLSTIGCKPDRSKWKIGIANPENKNEMLLYLPLNNSSIATSGNYEQYFMNEGIKYSHNINPINGMPVKSINSVSVVSPGAELSDALATAVYIMGAEAGIHFIDQLPNTHAIILDDKNRILKSKNIHILENS